MTKIALLLLGVAVGGNGAQAQQRVVALAGQDYTIEDAMSASGNNVTYRWFRDGVPIENATSAAYTIPANLAKMANGLSVAHTQGSVFQRVAYGLDCAGGVAMSNSVTIYFCDLMVNGVCWARANADECGRISSNPWDFGNFYQWNKVSVFGYSPTSPAAGTAVSGWNSTPDLAATWTNGVPCPAGWRLPTVEDFQNLHAASQPEGGLWFTGGTRGIPAGVNGRIFGYNTAYCTMSSMTGCIFLPAAGTRAENNGALTSQNSIGRYWSSVHLSSMMGFRMNFYNTDTPDIAGGTKSYANSIRCVIDVQ